MESSFESEIICEIDQNGAGWSNKQKDSTSTSSIFHWLMNKQKTNKSSGHEHFFILFFFLQKLRMNHLVLKLKNKKMIN